MVVEQVFMTQSKKIPKLISFRRCYQNSDGWVYFPEDPFKDIQCVCHMINTQLVVEMMVDLVVADEMFEKVGKALEILWWKPKNWTGLKIIRLLRKPVWNMFVCLFVSIQSTRKPKMPKKVKGGMTCKVSPVAMFVFANNPMFFVNLMIEMTMSSRFLGRWVLRVRVLKLIIPWWRWWMNSRLWLCVSPLLFTC